MREICNVDVLAAKVEAVGKDTYLKSSVAIRDHVGPATERLNRFFSDTQGASFYEKPFLHTDKFFLKYTFKEWQDILCRQKTNSEAAMEYADADVEYVHQLLYRFQKACELKGLPTRNPFAFFRRYCFCIDSKNDFCDLCAVCDRDFLFDSAAVRQLPRIFVSREVLNTIIKAIPSDTIFRTNSDFEVYPLIKKEPEKRQRSIAMAEQQCRELQLMLPGRIEYGKYFEKTMNPTIECQQERIQAALISPDSTEWSMSDYPAIGKICMNGFLWYLKTRNHLGLSKIKRETLDKDIKRIERELLNETSFAYGKIMEALLMISQEKAWAPYSLLLIYRVMTKYRSDIAHNRLPELKKTLNLNRERPTVQLRSNADTARKEYRCNILFFQKLCTDLAKYLSEEDLARLRFMYEFMEPYSEERYASAAVVSADADSDLVRNYIQFPHKGDTGEFIFANLVPIMQRVKQNLEISPYDLFPFYRWSIGREAAYQRLYSNGNDNGLAEYLGQKARGRTTSFWTAVCQDLDQFKKENTENYEKLRWKYYHEAFETSSSYGSGLPTYEWAFSVMEISDYLLGRCPRLKQLDKAFDDASELLEIAIHRYLLQDITERIYEDVQKAGKRFFYSPLLLRVKQEGESGGDGLCMDDENTFIQARVSFLEAHSHLSMDDATQ